MENFYDVLQINFDASESEIKRAYSKLVRKYTPENSPHEFDNLRIAYEVLGNAKSRSEYDAKLKYGDEIEEHDKLGREAMDKEKYKKAILEYKKILLIQPSLAFARNMLGLALLTNNNYDEAILQFEKLVMEYQINSTYWYNLGAAYESKELYDKSEESYLRAYELDKINSDIVLRISSMYFKQNLYDKSIAFLRLVIRQNGEDTFDNFIYYFEIFNAYLRSDRINAGEEIIDEIENIIADNEEEKKYVALKFGKLAEELFDAREYSLAEQISKRAMSIDTLNGGLISLYKDAVKFKRAHGLIDKLMDDDRIIGPIKGPVFYYFNYDEKNKAEHEKDVQENFDAIQNYIDNEPKTLLDSLLTFKKDYHELYSYRKETYDEISLLAKPHKINTATPQASSSSSCFVATAAFGTPWADEINILRSWRDQVLVDSVTGKVFINFYYKVGPYMAKVVEKSSLLKSLVRNIIYRIIKVVHKKYNI